MPLRKQTVTILCYLALATCFSSFFWTLMIASGHVGAGKGLYVAGLMWCPAAAALTIGCSVIMTWFRLVSNSVWPCAILHASHNLFIQGFFTPLTGARGTLTPYVIDEFGVAVPLIIVLFAIGFWLNRDRALQLSPAITRSTAPH
jgi:hypothetical protein